MIGQKLEKHPGAFFAVFSVFISLCFYASGVLSGLDSTITSLIYQLGYNEKEIQKGIWILKKDEKTSSLIDKPVTRRDFASILRQIGRGKTMRIMNSDGSSSIQKYKFLEMRIGFLKNGETGLISVPLLYDNPEDVNPEGMGFFSFSENILRLFQEFFEFPEIPTGTFSDFVTGKMLSFTPKVMNEAEKFFQKIIQSSFHVTLRIFPKENVVVQLFFQMTIDPSLHFQVPPAKVIGWDVLLQGEKVEEEDNLLEQALGELETPIVLAAQCEKSNISFEGKKNVRPSEGVKSPINERAETTIETSLLFPQKKFLQKQASLGLINVTPDSKSFVTRVPLFSYIPGRDWILPGFSLLVAMKALDRDNPGNEISYAQAMEDEFHRILPRIKNGTYKGGFHLPDRFIPTDIDGNMYVYFLGSTDSGNTKKPIFPSFSCYEAFDDPGLLFYQSQNSERVTELSLSSRQEFCRVSQNYGNRIILLGTFEKSDSDFFPTPMTVQSPLRLQEQQLMGIEIHANALANILNQRYLKPPADFFSVILMISSTLLLGLLIDHLSSLVGCLLSLLFLSGAFLYSYFLYHYQAQIFQVSPFVCSFPLTWAMTSVVNEIRERRRANATKGLFQRLVSPGVVQYLIENPAEVRLGGQRKELSIFFSDLAGFTTIAESLSPEDLVVLMNEYLGEMTRLLFKHGGTLDKYIGDAVMAYWNFPVAQSDHAVRACLYTLECHERLGELQQGWAKRGLPKAYARAGINTAKVAVGLVGSEIAQMNFTLLGDGVNLASRLEGANKEYGTLYMISDSTYQLAKDHVTTRFLDFLAVKGKKEPVKVHQLVAAKGKEPPGWSELFSLYQKGIDQHLERKWNPAIASFEEILSRWPEDGPSKTYLKRCHEYIDYPPPEKWDGSYHLTHK